MFMNEKILLAVIKGVYKTLFFTEYKVIMLFLNIHQREVDHHQHRTVQSTASKLWFECKPIFN